MNFKEYLISKRISAKTAKQYNAQVGKFLNMIDDRITRADLVDKAIEFCNENPRVYIRRYALLHFFLYLKKAEEYTGFKEQTRGYKQKTRLKLEKALSIEEYKTLVEELPYDYSLILEIMFWGALRIEEVLPLKKENIKKVGNKVRISVIGKGDKRISVFMPSALSDKILLHIDRLKRNENLFNITYAVYRKKIKQYGEQILGKDITSHAIGKHTRSQYEFNRGTRLIDIKDILHHSSINTTLIYKSESGINSKKIIEEREKEFN